MKNEKKASNQVVTNLVESLTDSKTPKKQSKKPAKTEQKIDPTENLPKKSGVISTIISLIEKSEKTGISKAEILAQLVVLFPDRKSDEMQNTVKVQVPSRISKEKFKLEKLDNGNFRKA